MVVPLAGRFVQPFLSPYLDVQVWQIEEILKGIEEADAGDFASEAEVNAVFERWTRRAG